MNIRDFHSTMVRLKQISFSGKLAKTDQFPFHYGAIETGMSASAFPREGVFPFHYGAIETPFHLWKPFLHRLFPFHYGAIETRLERYRLRPIQKISIPLWCD